MAETIPQNVFEKLEREWRVIDAERPRPAPKDAATEATPVRRLRIGRVD
ncbi:MAG: hypothetical protein KJ947_25895 [Alphaproteobacteria bacterium]|mgnify:CR=1 FL=1|nr:hypothetical protein [Alphaproteobacteria bacterium]MBU1552984.1 hypothetical protein [Alphaproteobacteria bacterium]MBU2338256.1 hypothetical protein [Alphaproteobacteria bacterium]MBU2388235.1 hypothetical protein [Alphaproteobacteria bacterium]